MTTLTHEIPKTAENCETQSDGRRTSEDHITHLSRTAAMRSAAHSDGTDSERGEGLLPRSLGDWHGLPVSP